MVDGCLCWAVPFSAPAHYCVRWAQGQPGTTPLRRGRTDASATCSTGSLSHVRGESVRDTSLVEAAEVADVSMDGTVLGVASESGGSLQGSHASGGRVGGSLTADALRSADVRLEVEPTSVCEVFGQELLVSLLARSRSANLSGLEEKVLSPQVPAREMSPTRRSCYMVSAAKATVVPMARGGQSRRNSVCIFLCVCLSFSSRLLSLSLSVCVSLCVCVLLCMFLCLSLSLWEEYVATQGVTLSEN